MSRLDDTIATVAYILDCLMAYRNIADSGNCNICKNNDCRWKPKPGQLVRYNCPHYKADKDPCAPPERYKEITKDIIIQNAARWFVDGYAEEE